MAGSAPWPSATRASRKYAARFSESASPIDGILAGLTGFGERRRRCYACARMPIHDWASMSWPAFQALAAGRAIAVLPLGAIEAHGPHLPLGTDLVIAAAMAKA